MRLEAPSLAISLSLVLGCAWQTEYSEQSSLSSASGTRSLRLTLKSRPDPFGGPQALGFSLVLENGRDAPLHDCKLRINESYTASIAALEVDRGLLRGNEARGDSGLGADERLELAFHHDNNNHLITRSVDGGHLPTSSRPNAVSLECKEGSAQWVIEAPHNNSLKRTTGLRPVAA